MVSNENSEKQGNVIALIEGETRCGGKLPSGVQCPSVHGGRAASSVDGSTFTVRFDHAIVRDGVISPVCGMCMIRSLGQAVPLAQARELAQKQIAEMRAKLDRALGIQPAPAAPAEPMAARKAPQPVMPPVSRVPAVRKDAPKPEARRDERRAKGKQPKQPRKGQQPLRERRPPKADKAVERHLADLKKAQAFDEVFVERKGCSFKRCSAQHGAGFITKPFETGVYPVCDAGLRAARAFKREREAQGGRAPFLTFSNVGAHKDFVARMKARDARDAMMAQAIMERRFASSSKPQCGLIGCEKPGQPAARIEVDGEKRGSLKVSVELCPDCARAARRLRDELRTAGKPLFFRFISSKKRPEPKRDEHPAPEPFKGNAMHEALAALMGTVPAKAPAAPAPEPDPSEGDVGSN